MAKKVEASRKDYLRGQISSLKEELKDVKARLEKDPDSENPRYVMTLEEKIANLHAAVEE
jgi:hypothetical protein